VPAVLVHDTQVDVFLEEDDAQIMLIDDFAAEEECDALLQQGSKNMQVCSITF
jgi:hypothetical protein